MLDKYKQQMQKYLLKNKKDKKKKPIVKKTIGSSTLGIRG